MASAHAPTPADASLPSDQRKDPQHSANYRGGIASEHNNKSDKKFFYSIHRRLDITGRYAADFTDKAEFQCPFNCRSHKPGQKPAGGAMVPLMSVLNHVFLSSRHKNNVESYEGRLFETCGRVYKEFPGIKFAAFRLRQWGDDADNSLDDQTWEEIAPSTVKGQGDFESKSAGFIDYFKLVVTNVTETRQFLRLEKLLTKHECVFDIRQLDSADESRIAASYASARENSKITGFDDFQLDENESKPFLIRLFPPKEMKSAAAASKSGGELPETRLGVLFLVGEDPQNCDFASVCLSFDQLQFARNELPPNFNTEKFASSMVAAIFDLPYISFFTELKMAREDADYFIRGKPRMPGHGNEYFVPSKQLQKIQTALNEKCGSNTTWRERQDAVAEMWADQELRPDLELLMEFPAAHNCRRQALLQLEMDMLAERYNLKPEGPPFDVHRVTEDDHQVSEAVQWSRAIIVKISQAVGNELKLKIGRPFYLVKTEEIQRAATATEAAPGQPKTRLHLFRALPLLKSDDGEWLYLSVGVAFVQQTQLASRRHSVQCNMVPCANRAVEIAIKCYLNRDWSRSYQFPFYEAASARLNGEKPTEGDVPPANATKIGANIQLLRRCFKWRQFAIMTGKPFHQFSDGATAVDRAVGAYDLYASATEQQKTAFAIVHPELRGLTKHYGLKFFSMILPEHSDVRSESLDGLITGAAGSGKTTLAMEAGFQTVIAYDAKNVGPFVVFCVAATNFAVDNALRKFHEQYGPALDAINSTRPYDQQICALRIYSTGETLASEMHNIPPDILKFANIDPTDPANPQKPYLPACHRDGQFYKTYQKGRRPIPARIVFTTVPLCLVHFARHFGAADAVPVMLMIVEELSQLNSSQALALRTTLRDTPFVWVGDDAQLPAFHESAANQQWFLKALKEARLGQQAAKDTVAHPTFLRTMSQSNPHLLHIQCCESNRVPDAIMQPIAECIYQENGVNVKYKRPLAITNKELRSEAPNVFDRNDGLRDIGLEEQSAFLVPVDGHFSRNASRSCYNLREAAAVSSLVAYLARKSVKPQRMVILSPYKAQIEVIKAELRKLVLEGSIREPPLVHTIDSHQGQEQEVVIMSLVRTQKPAAPDFSQQLRGQLVVSAVDDRQQADDVPIFALQAEAGASRQAPVEIGFLADQERMLVGVTRTRCKLFIVADENIVAHTPVIQRIPLHKVKLADIR